MTGICARRRWLCMHTKMALIQLAQWSDGVSRRPLAGSVGATQVELGHLPNEIRAEKKAALDGLTKSDEGLVEWREHTLRLGECFLIGRQKHQNDNNAFGEWLNANGLGDDFIDKNDRAALIGMATHRHIAKRVLETTKRRSWQLIWREEIAPEVEISGGFPNARKTPPPGRPRKSSEETRQAVRPLIEAGKTIDRSAIAKQLGVGEHSVQLAVVAERAALETRKSEGMVELASVRKRFHPLFERVREQSKRHIAHISKTELALIAAEGERLLKEWKDDDAKVGRTGRRAASPSRSAQAEGGSHNGAPLQADPERDLGFDQGTRS